MINFKVFVKFKLVTMQKYIVKQWLCVKQLLGIHLVALFIFLMWLVWGFCYVKHVEIIYSDHLVGLKNGDFSYNRYFIYSFFLKVDFVNHGSSLTHCHEIDNFPKSPLLKCL